jgi:hypothetical protein
MCQLSNCKYIEIIDGMPNDQKMYIHHDEKLIPFWIDYLDRQFIRLKRKTLKKHKGMKSNIINIIKLRTKTIKNKIFNPTIQTYY